MSDFSGMEHSFALPAMPVDLPLVSPGGGVPQARARSYDVQLHEIEFRRLHAADEMHAIQKMRAEIQLPGTALADPGFRLREKKRTGKALSARLSGTMTSSER